MTTPCEYNIMGPLVAKLTFQETRGEYHIPASKCQIKLGSTVYHSTWLSNIWFCTWWAGISNQYYWLRLGRWWVWTKCIIVTRRTVLQNNEVTELLMQNWFTFHYSLKAKMLKDGSVIVSHHKHSLNCMLMNRNCEASSSIHQGN